MHILGPERDQLAVGTTVTLVGFGLTKEGDAGERRTTEQQIARLTPQFVGLDQSNGHGICSGDSGGPVLVDDAGEEAIAAVNSLGDTSCKSGGASIRISRFAPFFADAIANIAGPAASTGANPVKASAADDSGCSMAIVRSSIPFEVSLGATLVCAAACYLGRRRFERSARFR